MKIYNDEEMELINNVFDLIALKFNSKEFSDLVREIKELIKENQKYAREIERLNKELQDTKEHLGEYLYEQEEENKKLKNIIKEVKEYIKENCYYDEYETFSGMTGGEVKELLEILDKGE